MRHWSLASSADIVISQGGGHATRYALGEVTYLVAYIDQESPAGPPAQLHYGRLIVTGKLERHSSSGPEAVGADAFVGKSHVAQVCQLGGVLDCLGNLGWPHLGGCSPYSLVRPYGSGRRTPYKFLYKPGHRLDWAGGFARLAMVEDISAATILLVLQADCDCVRALPWCI